MIGPRADAVLALADKSSRYPYALGKPRDGFDFFGVVINKHVDTLAELKMRVKSRAKHSDRYDSEVERKQLLKKLIEERFDGSQAEFARKIKRSPAQVNQWLTGHRALGDAGARNIELELGLPSGYFDNPARENRDPVVAEFAWIYTNTSDEGRSFLDNAIKTVKLAYPPVMERRKISISVIQDRRK